MFETVLPIIVPIFACAGLGWLWIKFGRPFDIATMTPLVTYIGAPCLVFSSMVHLSVGAEALADMVLATILALVCFGVIGAIGLRIFRLAPSRYLSPLVFTNTGNMGMPLCLFAFGAVGLELAAVFFTVSMVMMLLFGVWLMSGEATPKKVFAAPLPYALAAAFAFRGAEVEPPAWLYNTTSLLGDMTVPLMLFSLGVSLAGMRVVSLRRSLILAVARLVMGLGVGVALAAWFGLEGVIRGVFIIECTMPPAVFNYLYARLYNQAPEETASVILLSRVISSATLPLLLHLVLGLGGT